MRKLFVALILVLMFTFIIGSVTLAQENISQVTKPNSNDMPTAPLGTFSYIVKSGGTLSEIAKRYNTTVSNILIFNQIAKPNLIYVDQKIIIPQSPPEAIIYTVHSGDTLYSIAQKHGTQIDTIVDFNYLSNPNLINSGQKLVVPVSLR